MRDYWVRKVGRLPRLPLKGSLDLTHRCDFNCLHCWVRIPPGAPEKHEELRLEEILAMVDEARAMGCREWALSGGEPMLRSDFPEIFDAVTRRFARYSLNTNGSLITHEIARLMRRKGVKMVSLYGATVEVYDRVTRTPGAFEAVMRGFAYLREAHAGFIVQLIPMRANFHQWDTMLFLAQSLSPHWRVGAPWLYLAGDEASLRNAEIADQRLSPRDVITLERPDPGTEERMKTLVLRQISYAGQDNTLLPPSRGDSAGSTLRNKVDRVTGSGHRAPAEVSATDDRLFARCIDTRRDFHIDPYGKMTFCSFIKDPALRYDLRGGTFKEAWETFIPSLKDHLRGGAEYLGGCGACVRRSDCRWCPAYAYLETGHYGAPIPYLCEMAQENVRFKAEWRSKHHRYFQIAGITVRVESDLDLSIIGFKKELDRFGVEGPGEDNVTFRHYFELPNLKDKDLGREVYRKPPWAIFHKNSTWYYLGISPVPDDPELHRVAVFNADHTDAAIYSTPRDETRTREKGFASLSLFPTDQVWLAPLLADRHAVLLHSAAVILNGQGLIFVGKSGSGKSTTVTMLKELSESHGSSKLSVEVLCDDRNAVRRWTDGWHVHATWSHGDVADVSPTSAPLRAVLFLRQATCNEMVPLTDRKEIWRLLLSTLVKPMVTADWWHKELDVIEKMVSELPFYTMRFDKSGAIVQVLARL